MTNELREAIDRYCDRLTENAAGTYSEATGLKRRYVCDYKGKKYLRVVMCDEVLKTGELTHNSAHSFVKVEDGSIWKPAGWKGPAKNFSRGNVFTDVPRGEYLSYGFNHNEDGIRA